MFSHVLVEGPAAKALTVEEAKRQLRLPEEFVADDDYLGELIDAAIDVTETYIHKSLINQKWKLTLDGFPLSSRNDDYWDGVREGPISMLQDNAPVELPRHPVVAVDSINVYAPDDQAQLVEASVYHLNQSAGRVSLRYGKSWPSTIRPFDGVEIIYTSGHGTQANNVPAAIRQALRFIVAVWYENREIGDLPKTATDILDKYKVLRL